MKSSRLMLNKTGRLTLDCSCSKAPFFGCLNPSIHDHQQSKYVLFQPTQRFQPISLVTKPCLRLHRHDVHRPRPQRPGHGTLTIAAARRCNSLVRWTWRSLDVVITSYGNSIIIYYCSIYNNDAIFLLY